MQLLGFSYNCQSVIQVIISRQNLTIGSSNKSSKTKVPMYPLGNETLALFALTERTTPIVITFGVKSLAVTFRPIPSKLLEISLTASDFLFFIVVAFSTMIDLRRLFWPKRSSYKKKINIKQKQNADSNDLI